MKQSERLEDMRKGTVWFIGLFAAAFGVSCTVNTPIAGNSTPVPVEPTGTTTAGSNPALTSLVGELLQSPGKAGTEVEITGYFRGWDVLKEMGASPPVTRSDWVVADNTGAIYVTGMMPKELDPASSEQAWRIVRLAAVVRVREEQVYLEAQSVELVPEQ